MAPPRRRRLVRRAAERRRILVIADRPVRHRRDRRLAGGLGAGLERLIDHVLIAGPRQLPGHGVNSHQPDARRDTERNGRLVLEGRGHEIAEYRRRDRRAGLVRAEAAWIVVTDEDAEGEIGRKSDEPGVVRIIRRAGLAGERLADRRHDAAGAALDDALQDRDDLVGAARIGDLLAVVRQLRLRLILPYAVLAALARALVGAIDGDAVAVLDAVDQRRRDAFAAVVQHGIGGGELERRRLAGAQHLGILTRHVIHDAEALDRLADRVQPDRLTEASRDQVARLLDSDAQG